MEDARALLDSLMGPSRDKSKSENLRDDGWKEGNVCKRFLVGFCPNSAQDNWFHNTRRKDINVCTKIHSDRLKADFEKHPDRERYQAIYEKEFLDFLEGLVREADAWIARETKNAAGPGKKLPPQVKEKIVELKAKSEQLMKDAEDFGDKNDLTSSQAAVTEANRINQEIAQLKEEHTYEFSGEVVCEVCGVRCNPDSRADYQAHVLGKLHEGYTTIRAKVKELREKVRNKEEKNGASDAPKESKEGGGGDKEGRDKEKERNRDRDRDRDRGRERDRDRRSRDRRDRRREPSRSRSRRRRR
mmetsp:Transcript_22632/g.52794  ORF Transcript_22632/g.52794 Transcript_22632/m.52794 type:complete len:301 (+) Transcript_22632:113-1015(+)